MLKKVKTVAAKAINGQEEMIEVLESRLEKGVHLTHNGDEIYYPGEQIFGEWQGEKKIQHSSKSVSSSLE